MVLELPKGVFPELVAAKEASRYAIDSPWFDAKAGAVRATDGRMAISIPVEHYGGEETGSLPAAALKAFRKEAKYKPHVPIVGVNGSVSCLGITMPRPAECNAPDVGAVIPAKQKASEEGYTVICLNAVYLAKIAKALGVESVRLQIESEATPIRVDPAATGADAPAPSAVGVLMPIDERAPKVQQHQRRPTQTTN
jgi:hypothetical protein